MALDYIKEFSGYIADVPKVWFKRCDGKIFCLDKLTQCSGTINQNNIDITGGQSLFPLATIPGPSTLEYSCSSAAFDPELFALANTGAFVESTTFAHYVTGRYELDTTAHTITLEYKAAVDEDDGTKHQIQINGLEEDTAAGAGKFVYSEVDNKGVITFDASEEGDAEGMIEVTYVYTDTVEELPIDNASSAIGELVMEYPVYNDGSDLGFSPVAA